MQPVAGALGAEVHGLDLAGLDEASYQQLRGALRDHLVLVHASLVDYCARGFLASGEPVEDLVQEGYIGLVKAVDRYDPDKGIKFSTYACHLISGEIRHYLRDLGRLIHEPGWHSELRQRIVQGLLYGEVDRNAKARARVGLAILLFASIYGVIAGRLILRSGVGNVGIFLAAYALLFTITQWITRWIYEIVGGHDTRFWLVANDVLSVGIAAVTEPARVALLAAAFGYCLLRWSEVRMPTLGTPVTTGGPARSAQSDPAR